ncbi:hypothetical protein N9Z72_00275 [Akkermansiaceae bacterium]|nr:hypothetical protein [Akkermansiaceae bacterium]
MAKNILKEAIADAKAVREVALANAKAALEEAFTPKLQSMLSAKLSETLNEEEDELEENYMDEEMDETMDEMDVEEEMDEIAGMDEEDMGEGADLDEEIDLEEILNELELEEGEDAEETVDEAKDKDEETMDEAKDEEEDLKEMEVNHKAETANRADYKAEYVHEGNENFDLDALLEEINNLDENEEEVNEYVEPQAKVNTSTSDRMKATLPGGEDAVDSFDAWMKAQKGYVPNDAWQRIAKSKFNENMMEAELAETKAALETVRTELNEVNLLNSKLLYVNRIFKANTLDEGQKLRVVETLDKAETAKEAKLIYETIKDTFTVANNKKTSFKNKTKSLKEGIGMASKAAGTSTAPKKEVISESNNMMARFQKLANITINE